ncbi:MAG: dienelactone hydrolase family protein [Alphaproteobacteria bacterium]|jgi:carboxymethylenebutenolidase|nr:dienelactone hydrolase family protein [Alphaproteobacteria bacterium]MBT4083221.1 dienelactone hydrolase family protein [Alphaproteobacteria bacterium]MBT4544283.1 dienelactone hydrolase family protein [Alphaproteobacteria bacterium]
MSTATITLTAADGHEFAAYESIPSGDIKGRLVVVQEIFGVNEHIRNVCDRFAERGFHAVAPAMFDRAERNFEKGYDQEGVGAGVAIMNALDWDKALADVQATVDHLKSDGPVGVVGYCWGGSIAWLAACRVNNVAAAVGYYGGKVIQFIEENPKCPTMLHFGEKDTGIPLTDVVQIAAKHAAVQVFTYPDAEHGFTCDARASYNKISSDQALARTVPHFTEHLAG